MLRLESSRDDIVDQGVVDPHRSTTWKVAMCVDSISKSTNTSQEASVAGLKECAVDLLLRALRRRHNDHTTPHRHNGYRECTSNGRVYMYGTYVVCHESHNVRALGRCMLRSRTGGEEGIPSHIQISFTFTGYACRSFTRLTNFASLSLVRL